MAVTNLGNVRGPQGIQGEQGQRGFSGLLPKTNIDYAATVTVNANTMTHISPLSDNIEILLGEEVLGYDNEWDFTIEQGDTAFSVSLPQISWGFGMAPNFDANTVTVCRLYKIGQTLCGEWSVL